MAKPTIEEVKALNDKIFGMLNEREYEILNSYGTGEHEVTVTAPAINHEKHRNSGERNCFDDLRKRQFIEYGSVLHVVINPKIGEYIGCTLSTQPTTGRPQINIMSRKSYKTIDAALADAKVEAVKAGVMLASCALISVKIVADSPALTSLQDILDVHDETMFENILSEIPALLRTMRQRSKTVEHVRFSWPMYWRPLGGPSAIISRYANGHDLRHEIDI